MPLDKHFRFSIFRFNPAAVLSCIHLVRLDNIKNGSYFYLLVHEGFTSDTSIVSTKVSRLDNKKTVGIFEGFGHQIRQCTPAFGGIKAKEGIVIYNMRPHAQVFIFNTQET